MVKIANSKIMGKYLKNEILKKYKSVRAFARACLEVKNETIDDTTINNMSNRLSQILKGTQGKRIQLDDLPIFSELLELSYEQILSAGKEHYPTFNHLTNYSIAFSNDPKEWERYLKHKDNLILNADEYGKTVIDYALNFKNYALLKYLMDKEYIWFVGQNPEEYWYSEFGAGTSIKMDKQSQNNYNVLDVRLKDKYELRTQMLSLAIDNDDLDMLNKLHARETSELYKACDVACYRYDEVAELKKQFDFELVEKIIDANEKILAYFSEEFSIKSQKENLFMYPYINYLIELLIKKENCYVISILQNAIKHNKNVFEKMSELYNFQEKYFQEQYTYDGNFDEHLNENIKHLSTLCLYFTKENQIVSYYSNCDKQKIIANLIKVEITSKDIEINQLIKKLNESYDKIYNRFLMKKL